MNQLYASYKERLLGAGVNVLAGTVRAVLLNTTAADGAGNFYAFDATDSTMADIPAGARIGAPQALANKTVVGGVFDADNIEFPNVTGVNAEAMILYLDVAGADGNKPLIAFIDDADGLPVLPNNGSIVIRFHEDGIYGL